MSLVKDQLNKVSGELKDELGVGNILALPQLDKVVVSVRVGRRRDKNQQSLVVDRLAKITGQKPAPRAAKKSIASFKVRQGETIGYQITLRGQRMYDFLDRLLHVAIPRMRDFRGFPDTVIDSQGNLSLGVREHTIFPETSDEEAKDVFGLGVTIVTTSGRRVDAQSRRQAAKAFFSALGFPFSK